MSDDTELSEIEMANHCCDHGPDGFLDIDADRYDDELRADWQRRYGGRKLSIKDLDNVLNNIGEMVQRANNLVTRK